MYFEVLHLKKFKLIKELSLTNLEIDKIDYTFHISYWKKNKQLSNLEGIEFFINSIPSKLKKILNTY